ncbi:MAG: lysophospholipid acyltransferase family protein, partial [Acidobacteriota bacterium]|nr:lysophospholipid acyltransferase family protein [Acidobacteriota bacterium]
MQRNRNPKFIRLMRTGRYVQLVPFSSLQARRMPAPLASALNRFLQIDRLEQLYRDARPGDSLCANLMRELEIEIQVTAEDLARVPASGAVVAISNHPFGLLDGALLTSLLTRVRRDMRVLTNRLLSELPEMAKVGIFIDPFERPESRAANARALKEAIGHLKAGGMLLVFPAGEVAHFDFRSGAVRDPEWRTTAARLIRLTNARALPILVPGSNSLPFQVLGMVHPRLRTAALPAELLNKRGRRVEVRIGGVIESARVAALSDEEATRYLRLRAEILARREPGNGGDAAPAARTPVAAEGDRAELLREIEQLPADCLLGETREMAVFFAGAGQIPRALREIGRLREVTFRAAGEGSGLDR